MGSRNQSPRELMDEPGATRFACRTHQYLLGQQACAGPCSGKRAAKHVVVPPTCRKACSVAPITLSGRQGARMSAVAGSSITNVAATVSFSRVPGCPVHMAGFGSKAAWANIAWIAVPACTVADSMHCRSYCTKQ